MVILLLAALLSSGLGSLFYLWQLKFAGASISAALSASSPVFSTPFSILLLGEKISRRIVIGTGLILFGVWLVIIG